MARRKILAGQLPLIDQLLELLGDGTQTPACFIGVILRSRRLELEAYRGHRLIHSLRRLFRPRICSAQSRLRVILIGNEPAEDSTVSEPGLTVQPPKPPPVILAPRTPSQLPASSTIKSSSALLTS